jgi:predicted esterase
MDNFKSYRISTKVHGYYLLQKAKGSQKNPLLVGFHGYGETAENQMHLLQQIPGIENWTVCSIQALHSFYISKGKVGYSWMTSQDRELRVKENVNYVNAVISEIKKSYTLSDTIVYHGFSQGTAIACRAAMLCKYRASGVILLGGDIPPEFKQLNKMKRLLLARGKRDKFYSIEQWEQDVLRIENSKIESHVCEFDGGHGTHEVYLKAAADFLKLFI